MTEPIGNALDEAMRKAEMYKRQLGGTSAALRRERQRTADLARLVRDMREDIQATMRDIFADVGYEAPEGTAYDERMRRLGIEVRDD